MTLQSSGNPYLARVAGDGNGGPDITTGWQQATLSLGTLAAGSHTLTLGGTNNKKTLADEYSEILFDDVTVATVGSAGGGDPNTVWLHKDHLGSIQAATDGDGAAALRRGYAPYGAQLWASAASFTEAKSFIGERLDDETGLLYLNARYYDPVMAQFLSADPSDPLQPGVGVNRYAYAGGNPVAYADPYGLGYANEKVERDIENATAGGGRPKDDWSKDNMAEWAVDKRAKEWANRNLIGSEGVAVLAGGVDSDFWNAVAGGLEATVNYLESHPEIIDGIAIAVGAGIDLIAAGPTGEGVPIAVGTKAGLETAKFSLKELAEALAARGAAGPLKGLGNIGSHGVVDAGTALKAAEKWLGAGYKEIAPDVFRSADNLRQFRMTNADLLPTHGKIGSHVHFEVLDDSGKVIENLHLPVGP